MQVSSQNVPKVSYFSLSLFPETVIRLCLGILISITANTGDSDWH
jgi:hypothetical protein